MRARDKLNGQFVVQIQIVLTSDEMHKLINHSSLLREDPRKPWTVQEMKQHARDGAVKVLTEYLKPKEF